ncbi:MAG TPA: ATP synthase F1 subunit delta [Coriobacteriia bacterium]|nr:ATP synthase F1 subunit delta [Coriobacteriia bacterium]
MTTSEYIGTYARALFDLANAAGDVDAVDAGFHAIVEAVRGSVELRDALADQALPAEKKRAVMAEIFAGKVAPEAVAIASVAVERGHGGSLGLIAERFGEVAEAERGVVVAEVTTAVALTDALRASLTEKLAAALGRPVSLRERVDGSILGGVRINVAGRVLDGSLSSQLDAMRATLTTASQGGEA